MPIYGVGIDLVRVERLEKISSAGPSDSRRGCSPNSKGNSVPEEKTAPACLALRFAAKEAFVKALGLGIRKPVLWLDIEVRQNPLGKPEISLSPARPPILPRQGIRSWRLSLTDDGEYAAAVVVLET